MSNRATYLVAGLVFAFVAFVVLWGLYIGPWLGSQGG